MKRKSVRNLLMLPLLTIALYSCGNAQDWQKVVPLKSTRTEVEALFGAGQRGYAAIYQLKEGSLFIEYSSGLCRPERNGGWNVPENVVVGLSFSPRHKKRVADLKIDPKKFKRTVDQHVIGIIYFTNEEDGITYEVQDGKVESIEYAPPKKYEYLYCQPLKN
jgi:hypothetical protein